MALVRQPGKRRQKHKQRFVEPLTTACGRKNSTRVRPAAFSLPIFLQQSRYARVARS